MFLMYVDESGDPGTNKNSSGKLVSPTKYYILSGFIIHESNWNVSFDKIKDFRRFLKSQYKVKMGWELHSTDLLSGRGDWFGSGISETDRVDIFLETLKFEASLPTIQVLNAVALKEKINEPSAKTEAELWRRLLERFQMFIQKSNASSNLNENGIVIADESNEKVIRETVRKMRVYNPVKSHFKSKSYPFILTNVIEDPFFKDSRHSYFVQLSDVNSYALQRIMDTTPKSGLAKINSAFKLLDPILLKQASKKNQYGVVVYP